MKGIITILFSVFLAIGWGQGSESLQYQGGTYSFGKSLEDGPVGNIIVYPVSDSSALFYLEVCSGEPSYRLGLLCAEMQIDGSVGTFYYEDGVEASCHLQFTFSDKKLDVKYVEEKTSCGFGHGVYVNNTYELTDNTIPESFIYANGDTIEFIQNAPPSVKMDYYALPDPSDDEDAQVPLVDDLYSFDCTWVKNKSLHQVLIEGINYESYEGISVHYDTRNVPDEIMRSLPLTTIDGELVSAEEKLKSLKGQEIDVAEVDKSAFTSVNGVSLGDSKEKLLEMYGPQQTSFMLGNLERLTWEFLGEMDYSPFFQQKGVRIAEAGFGYIVHAYFKDGKLVAIVLRREIP